VAVRGEPGSCRPLFIGAGRRLSGRYFELEELLRPAMVVGKNIPPLTRPAGSRPGFAVE
jgi:hypothetical protein